jgi:hypothetical protein
MSVTDIPNFEKLSDLEKVELAGELYASIRNPEALPVPLAQALELQRRGGEFERNPGSALSQEPFWTQVKGL